MSKTSKNRKGLRLQNNTIKKTGGFTAYVNISSDGVILNKGSDRYKSDMERFYVKIGNEKRMFYEKSTGIGLNGKSLISHKTIGNLISHGVICTSIAETAVKDTTSFITSARYTTKKTPIVFVFDKDQFNTQASVVRITTSNYYTIRILYPPPPYTEGVPGIRFPDRVLQKIMSLKGDDVRNGEITYTKVKVNKDDSDFWFNLKPYIVNNKAFDGFLSNTLLLDKIKNAEFVNIPTAITDVVGIHINGQIPQNVGRQQNANPSSMNYSKQQTYNRGQQNYYPDTDDLSDMTNSTNSQFESNDVTASRTFKPFARS
jgi:hypothetical protein